MKDNICLLSIIDAYCAISWQVINAQKSQVTFNPTVSNIVKCKIIHLLNIHEKQDVWEYLGVPISGNKLLVGDFNFIEDKLLFRIES